MKEPISILNKFFGSWLVMIDWATDGLWWDSVKECRQDHIFTLTKRTSPDGIVGYAFIAWRLSIRWATKNQKINYGKSSGRNII